MGPIGALKSFQICPYFEKMTEFGTKTQPPPPPERGQKLFTSLKKWPGGGRPTVTGWGSTRNRVMD